MSTKSDENGGAGAESGSEQFLERVIKLEEVGYGPVWSVALSGVYAVCSLAGDGVLMWEVANGRFVRNLKGHTKLAYSMAISRDGSHALSGSDDNTARVWELASGSCVRVLEGHTGIVFCVAFSSDGVYAVSGSYDRTVRVWEVASGRCLLVLQGHFDWIRSVAFSVDGMHAISGSDDGTVRVWDLDTGHCVRVLEGHKDWVMSVAFSGDGVHAISGSDDGTLRVWELDSGRCVRVLEGHSDSIKSVSLAKNGVHALSASDDTTVRVWEVTSGRCVCILQGHTESVISVAISEDGVHAYSADANRELRIWNLAAILQAKSPAILNSEVVGNQLQYSNAKVLLVGDTGVGKSGLACRLVHNRFEATLSSHSRQAHTLEAQEFDSNGVKVHRETILWDLAGQPAFRLVHQLSMDDAAVACVLFDNRSSTNPFEGAAYWSQVLDQARTNTRIRKLLVASRIDVGGLPASRERIEAFAREHGFEKFVETSAYLGDGCPELADAIRSAIDWDQLPTVTTDGPLGPLRKYVAQLKGETPESEKQEPPARLMTVQELYVGFAAHYGQSIAVPDFVAYLKRLEDTDAIDLLTFHTTGAEPQLDTLVLLDPTRVDAYASALLVAAKDEPDGPGHLLESRIRSGDFRLADEERLPDREAEKHVLWFVLENLLDRDLALREPIQGQDFIVFPSQCTAELTFPGVATFGVALGFAGPVRSIYATLIAQLAHYEGFCQREFFHDAAVYTPDGKGQCIIRFRELGRGRAELELSFDPRTPADVRQGFIEFVLKHLEGKSTPESVTRRYAHYCAHCHEPFDDKVVRTRIAAGKRDLMCPLCDEKTPLLDLLAPPTDAADDVAKEIDRDARKGKKRMTAGLVIKAKEVEGRFDIFLSHNSKDKPVVEEIAKRLKEKGIRAWLDKWHLVPGDTITHALEKAITTIPCAGLCYGPADIGKWHIMEFRAYIERYASGHARMIPMILPGVDGHPELPIFIRQTLWVDLRKWDDPKDDGFYRLVCGIIGKVPGDGMPSRFGAGDVARWQGFEPE